MSEREQASDGPFGIRKRKALIAVGLAAALSVAAVAVLGQVTSYGKLEEAARTADKWWLPLCLVGELVAYAGYVVAYRSVAAADGGPLLRYRDAARVIGLGLGAYVVGSGAGGLTVDFWAMRTAGAATHEAARRTLALNTLQAAALGVLAAVAASFRLTMGTPYHTGFVMAAIWLGIVPAAFAASAVVTSGRFAPRLLHAADTAARPSTLSPRALGRWLRVKGRKALADTIGGVVFVRHVLGRPRRYWLALVGFPLFWVGDFFILWVALRAFGVHLSPTRLVVAEATAWALNFLPLPGGGSGISEVSVAYTLHAVGVPLSEALFGALTYRTVNFWLPILPAVALLARVRNLRDDLAGAGRAERDEDVAVQAWG